MISAMPISTAQKIILALAFIECKCFGHNLLFMSRDFKCGCQLPPVRGTVLDLADNLIHVAVIQVEVFPYASG